MLFTEWVLHTGGYGVGLRLVPTRQYTTINQASLAAGACRALKVVPSSTDLTP